MRLLISLLLLLAWSANAQPLWRNFFSTNQNPRVTVVAGTNATVQASTVGTDQRIFTVNGVPTTGAITNGDTRNLQFFGGITNTSAAGFVGNGGQLTNVPFSFWTNYTSNPLDYTNLNGLAYGSGMYGMTSYWAFATAPGIGPIGIYYNGIDTNTVITTNGGSFTGAILDLSASSTAPGSNQLVTAAWVRGLFNTGAAYYNTTNIDSGATNTDSTSQYVYTYQSTIPISDSRTYTTGDFLTNNGYVGAVVTTNTFSSLAGAIVVNAYFAYTGGSASPTLSIKPEIYISSDKTNWYGEVAASPASIIHNTTNLYQWLVDYPRTAATNSSGFYVQRRFKVTGITGSGTRTLRVFVGTNAISGTADAAHLTMQSPTATEGNAYLANNQAFTGSNYFAGDISVSTVSTRPGVKMVVIGDSLSEPGYSSWAYWVNLRSALNGITILTNVAAGGRSVSNMLALDFDKVTLLAPTNTGNTTYAAVWGGINDRNDDTADQIWQNVSNLWAKGASAGYRVIGFTVTPVASATDAIRLKLEQVNSNIRRYSSNCFQLIDTAALFGNASDSIIHTDGLHFQDEVDELLARHVEWVISLGGNQRQVFSAPWQSRVFANGGHVTNLNIHGVLDGKGLSQIAMGNLAGNATLTYSAVIGDHAAEYATNADVNAFGTYAAQNATNTESLNAFGRFAGQNATDASYANMFGYYAGNNAANGTNANMFGINAGRYATNAVNANLFGSGAGQYAFNATAANMFGLNAGGNASGATYANFFGSSAGQYASNSTYANMFGNQAGQRATTATYANFFGLGAGQFASSATYGFFVGRAAGANCTNAARSIFLGPYAGTNRADTLWIDSKASAQDGTYQPLIYGEFDNRFLRINGNLNVTNAVTIGQTITATNGFIINSNSWTSAPTLTYGQNWYASSNGVPQVIAMDGAGNLTTNQNAYLANNQAFTGSNYFSQALNGTLPPPTNAPTAGARIVATSASSTAWTTGFLTNANYVRPDFDVPYSELTTNDAFAFLAPTNVSTVRYQPSVILVTNSTATAKAVTAPANVRTTGTWYVTNFTIFSFFNMAGRLTNAIAYPVY